MSEMRSLLPKLKGKLLEISIGDEYEELIMSDHIKKVNGVIYGTLENIIEDFLVINCFFVTKTGVLSDGNIVYLNSWNVKAFTEVNSTGSLNDVFLSSTHTRKMKDLLGIND